MWDAYYHEEMKKCWIGKAEVAFENQYGAGCKHAITMENIQEAIDDLRLKLDDAVRIRDILKEL